MNTISMTPHQFYDTRWQRRLCLPLQEIAAMSLLDFLGGPGTPEDEVEIDEAYGSRSVAEVAGAWAVIGANGKLSYWGEIDDRLVRSRIDPAFGHVVRHDDLILVECATGKVAGGVIGTDVVVNPALRRRGFGSELVGRMLALTGRMPVWSTAPCFSPDGYALRRHVHTRLQDPAWRAELDQDVEPLRDQLKWRGAWMVGPDGRWVAMDAPAPAEAAPAP